MRANDGEPAVRVRGLGKQHGKGEGLVRAVDGVDLDVADGETLAVMGPSGCGKSTLLYLLGGLASKSGWPTGSNPPAVRTVRRPVPAGGHRTCGLIWVTLADAQRLGAPAAPIFYLLNLKLADPADAQAFADAHSTTGLTLMTWQFISDQDASLVANSQQDLLIGSWLLALLAAASVAVLVGGRMAEQTRRVSLLKAVGSTPGLITAVLLAENLVLALLAAAAGLIAGRLTAPLLTSPGAGLIGTPGAPSALGATPGQISAGLSAAQLLPALPGAILGIPLGLGLYAAVSSGQSLPVPPAWSLAAVVLASLLVLTGLTAIPARIGARRPVAEVLQADAG